MDATRTITTDPEERRRAVLACIIEWRRTHDYGPAYRDIARLTGIPHAAVQRAIRTLRRLGRLPNEYERPRWLRAS